MNEHPYQQVQLLKEYVDSQEQYESNKEPYNDLQMNYILKEKKEKIIIEVQEDLENNDSERED